MAAPSVTFTKTTLRTRSSLSAAAITSSTGTLSFTPTGGSAGLFNITGTLTSGQTHWLEIAFSSPADLSGGTVVIFAFESRISCSSSKIGFFSDSNTNYRLWPVSLQNQATLSAQVIRVAISPDGGGATDTGTFDLSSVSGIRVEFVTTVTGSAGVNNSGMRFLLQDIEAVTTPLSLLGGEPGDPATIALLRQTLSGLFPGIATYPIFNGFGSFFESFFDIKLAADLLQNESAGIVFPANKTGPTTGIYIAGNRSVEIDTTTTKEIANLSVINSSSQDCSFLDSSATGNSLALTINGFNLIDLGSSDFEGRLINCETVNGGSSLNTLVRSSVSDSAYNLTGADIAGSRFQDNANAILIQTAGTYNLSGATFSGNTTNVQVDGVAVTLTLSAAQFASYNLDPDNFPVEAINGGTVTVEGPLTSLIAPNVAEGARYYIAHRQIFGVPSTSINTTTDGITLGNDTNGDAPDFSTEIPYTLVRVVLSAGATMPTTAPQIFNGGTYRAKSLSSGILTLSVDAGGTTIDFVTAGTNGTNGTVFALVAETQLVMGIAGSGGVSEALTLSNNALIHFKAFHRILDSGRQITSRVFATVVAWNSASGASIISTVNANDASSAWTELNRITALTTFNLEDTITDNSGLHIDSFVPIQDGEDLDEEIEFVLQGRGKIQAAANSSLLDGVLYGQNLAVWAGYIFSTDALRFVTAETFALQGLSDATVEGIEFTETSGEPLQIVGLHIRDRQGGTLIDPNTVGSIALNVATRGNVGLTTSGGSGDAPTEAEIYNYFTAGTRADAFKANVSGLLTTTGYTNSLPTNFSAMTITAQGAVTAGTVGDKTGYSLTTPPLTAQQTANAMLLDPVGTTGGNSLWAAAATGAVNSAALATRLTTDRASYLDKLNVSGTLAHTDNASTFRADISSLLTATAYSSSLPANFGALSINSSGHISRVTLVDTTTTNSDMRGTNDALTSLGTNAPTNWINAASISNDAISEIQSGLSTVTSESIYTYFTTSNRQDTFKATGFSTFNPSTQTVTVGGYSAGQSPSDLVNLSGLATSVNVTDARDAIITQGNSSWITATGFLTSANLPTNFSVLGITPEGYISRVVSNSDMRGTDNSLLSTSYVAPDNTGIGEIKAKTNQLSFTAGAVNANATTDVAAIVAGIEDALTIPTVVQIREEMDDNSTKLAEIKTIATGAKNAASAGL